MTALVASGIALIAALVVLSLGPSRLGADGTHAPQAAPRVGGPVPYNPSRLALGSAPNEQDAAINNEQSVAKPVDTSHQFDDGEVHGQPTGLEADDPIPIPIRVFLASPESISIKSILASDLINPRKQAPDESALEMLAELLDQRLPSLRADNKRLRAVRHQEAMGLVSANRAEHLLLERAWSALSRVTQDQFRRAVDQGVVDASVRERRAMSAFASKLQGCTILTHRGKPYAIPMRTLVNSHHELQAQIADRLSLFVGVVDWAWAQALVTAEERSALIAHGARYSGPELPSWFRHR